VKAHAPHIGLIVLALIVLGGVIYGGIRLSARRRTGRRGPTQESVGPSQETVSATATRQDSATPPSSKAPNQTIPVSAGDVSDRGAPTRSPSYRLTSQGSSGEWAVETHALTKRFGHTVAVDNVELFVPRGCAFGYLGPNGAGKTTLIRTLLGLTRADGGTMSLLGTPVPRQRRKALARVGAIVDEPRFHEHLTGTENLRLLAAARGDGAEARIRPVLERVGLRDRAADRVGSYSMGMRQRLGVASCLLGDPELLILDEPMNGLDPAGMHQMRLMIQSLVEEGRTVMLSSHLLDEVERTCDAVAIVDRGSVIRQGPIDELIRGANLVVQVECSDPDAAAALIGDAHISTDVTAGDLGLTLTLPAGASRDLVAEVNRRLVEGGIAVYRLQEIRATLEDWFLSVTSRFGDNP
jgi:ABC-2 type transport system ATP-binding protein